MSVVQANRTEMAHNRAERQASFPPELSLFLKVLVATVLLSLLDALVRWPLQGAPRAFSALLPANALTDLDCYWLRFLPFDIAQFSIPGNQLWAYPAPCALVYWLLYRLANLTSFLGADLLLGLPPLLLAASLFARKLHRVGLTRRQAASFVFARSVLSWPIYFSFERGNIETVLWLVLAGALACFITGRQQAAAGLLGFVAAFKLYPVLFFGLFLPRRNYGAMATGLLSLGLTTLVGLRYLDRDLLRSARFTAKGIHTFLQVYSARYLGDANGFDHSAWALFKLALRQHPQLILRSLPVYTFVAGLLAVGYYVVVLWRAPRFHQLLALCTLMVLLPATSFDYTLQAMYIPFAWLCVRTVQARRAGTSLPGTRPLFVAFALLFGPLVFLRSVEETIGGQAKALALLGILSLVARLPWNKPNLPAEAK